MFSHYLIGHLHINLFLSVFPLFEGSIHYDVVDVVVEQRVLPVKSDTVILAAHAYTKGGKRTEVQRALVW